MAVRLAPGVGDDLAAFASRGETILESIAVVGGDFVFARIARARAGAGDSAARDETGEDDAQTQRFSSTTL